MDDIPEDETNEDDTKKNEYSIEPKEGKFRPMETKIFLIKI